jgi:hypothetical protein
MPERLTWSCRSTGQRGTLHLDGTHWQGNAAAQGLLMASQPFLALVKLIGAEAQLGVLAPAEDTQAKPHHDGGVDLAPVGPSPGAPTGSPTPLPPGTPAPPVTTTPPGTTTPPPNPAPLCCGDIVTAGAGSAWYWEKVPTGTACRRAKDTLGLSCRP